MCAGSKHTEPDSLLILTRTATGYSGRESTMQTFLTRWLKDPGESMTNTVSPAITSNQAGHHSGRDDRRGLTNVTNRKSLDINFATFNCQYLCMDHLHYLVKQFGTNRVDVASLQGTRWTFSGDMLG